MSKYDCFDEVKNDISLLQFPSICKCNDKEFAKVLGLTVAQWKAMRDGKTSIIPSRQAMIDSLTWMYYYMPSMLEDFVNYRLGR